MIAELQRENARLQAEADGAKDRAAHRHREMMHANRRAEKAENALGRHTEERKAQEAKDYMLYCGYTQTIEGLEAQIKSQKTDSQKEAMDAQVKIIAETEDRLRKQFEGEIGVMRSQFKQAMQVLHNQVQELKKQLQQDAQRESSQNSQIATSTRAGHPIQSQQGSNAPVNARNDKRKRQDSTGDADAAPDPKRSRTTSTVSRAPDTMTKAKAPAMTRAPARRPTKPSQVPKSFTQQMGMPQNRHNPAQKVPFQVLQPPQQQATPPCSSSAEVSFQQYYQGVNTRRLAQGLPIMSQIQVQEAFSNFVQRINQESARSTFDRGGNAPAMQQQSPNTRLGQRGTQQQPISINLSLSDMQMHAGVQPSSLNQSKPKPFGQGLGASPNMLPPRNGQGVQFGTFQFQSPQKTQQLPPANLQGNDMGSSQLSATPELSRMSSMTTSTVEPTVDPLKLSLSGPSAFPALGSQDVQNFNRLGQDSHNNDGSLCMPTLDDFNSLDFNFNDPTFQQIPKNTNTSGPAAQSGTSAPPVSISAQAGSPPPQDWLLQDPHPGIPVDPALLPPVAQNTSVNPAGTTSASPAPPVPTFPQVSHQAPAVSTSSPVRSTPAPAQATRAPVQSTPAPVINDLPKPCLHCHERWWNSTCDADEPCANCQGSGVACERPLCHSDATGCANPRCVRVHTNDGSGYVNVVAKPKALKRVGKRDGRKRSPKEVETGQKAAW
ncbi:hypothetical protein G6514_006442 [Epicoccum nigrum]|nr:hypothetical protein G6514_006442 [Epicoccum nigrum]